MISPVRNEQRTVFGFSLAERDRRWNIGRQIMDEMDLEGLVVFGSREGAFPGPLRDGQLLHQRPARRHRGVSPGR